MVELLDLLSYSFIQRALLCGIAISFSAALIGVILTLKNYSMIGHGLGATPVAIANMNSVGNLYGHSEKAILVVTIVAAFLLDIFTMPCIILFMNLLS